jgi:glycosyltransferase involved in cell wall biosynthesis
MRILHIYSGNFYGGVERLLVNSARLRHFCPWMEPHYALCFEGRVAQDLRAAGAPVCQLGTVRASRPLSVRRARRNLRELLRNKPIDAVICHSPWPHAVFAPAVRAAKKPLVFWLHDAAKGRHWTERWAARTRPDLAICNSEFTLGTLSRLFPQTPGVVVHCPVPLCERRWTSNELDAVRAVHGVQPDSVVIVQPSRMEAWKGHRLHLEALGLLRRLPQWVCWMIGGPQRPHEAAYFQDLGKAVRRYGIEDRVSFLGWVPDVEPLLAASQIHCQPNIAPEPLGLTFLEAMAAGLPVVTTALGGGEEIVASKYGILVPPNDPQALAAALESLIRNPERRKELGCRGPARVKELCDPERQLNKLAEALDAVIGDRT